MPPPIHVPTSRRHRRTPRPPRPPATSCLALPPSTDATIPPSSALASQSMVRRPASTSPSEEDDGQGEQEHNGRGRDKHEELAYHAILHPAAPALPPRSRLPRNA
ncbi:hypothetical protein DFH09DRAFT_1353220 [Mycena vulgaris]|nr:hypothetical protein DFH09DRAFT_1353220 [Mycena vulgaris]